MDKKTKILNAVEALEKLYPDAICSLVYTDAFQLLIAPRLSAQCTDARVNMVTPALFEKYPDALSMSKAPVEDVERLIKTCGLYKTKAKDLVGIAKMIMSDFGGTVPDTIEQLTRLPGVGRKTANLLLGDLYGVPGSIVCDTHCIRICGRLGLSEGKEPEKVERQLRKILPPEKSSDFCHRIVLFGRDVCTARSPKCGECPLAIHCKHMNG